MRSFKEYVDQRDNKPLFGANLGAMKTANNRYGKTLSSTMDRNPNLVLGNKNRTKAFGVGTANSVFDMANDPKTVQSAYITMNQGLNQLKKNALNRVRNKPEDEVDEI